jgi:hypothetical protein
MAHDPMCKGDKIEYACMCPLIARVRADERRWVTACAGDELLNHKIEDGICACGMDAPNAVEHLAWIVSDYVRHSLKPEHEVKSLT